MLPYKFHDPEKIPKKFRDPEIWLIKFHDPELPLRPGLTSFYVPSLIQLKFNIGHKYPLVT